MPCVKQPPVVTIPSRPSERLEDALRPLRIERYRRASRLGNETRFRWRIWRGKRVIARSAAAYKTLAALERELDLVSALLQPMPELGPDTRQVVEFDEGPEAAIGDA